MAAGLQVGKADVLLIGGLTPVAIAHLVLVGDVILVTQVDALIVEFERTLTIPQSQRAVAEHLIDGLPEVLVIVVGTLDAPQPQPGTIVQGLYVVRIDNQRALRCSVEQMPVSHDGHGTGRVFAVDTVAIVDVDRLSGMLSTDKRQTVLCRDEQSPTAVLADAADDVRGQSVVGRQLAALLLGQIIDIDATAVGAYPQLVVIVHEERMDILVEIIGADGGTIVQFAHLARLRINQPDAVGRADGDAAVGQLHDVLYVINRVIAVARWRLLHQVTVQTAHPEVALTVVEQFIDVVVLQRPAAEGVELALAAVAADFVDALAPGGSQQRSCRDGTQAEHHGPPTDVLPLLCQGIV